MPVPIGGATIGKAIGTPLPLDLFGPGGRVLDFADKLLGGGGGPVTSGPAVAAPVITFANSFSVAGQGARADAASSPNVTSSGPSTAAPNLPLFSPSTGGGAIVRTQPTTLTAESGDLLPWIIGAAAIVGGAMLLSR